MGTSLDFADLDFKYQFYVVRGEFFSPSISRRNQVVVVVVVVAAAVVAIAVVDVAVTASVV